MLQRGGGMRWITPGQLEIAHMGCSELLFCTRSAAVRAQLRYQPPVDIDRVLSSWIEHPFLVLHFSMDSYRKVL